MIAHHYPLQGLFEFSAFRTTTFPPRPEATLNYATPREDHGECVVAVSASGWNSFTMNNFATASLLLHRYCPDGEKLRTWQLRSNIYLLLCRLCLSTCRDTTIFLLWCEEGQVGSTSTLVMRHVVSSCLQLLFHLENNAIR
jgi:hypothetical protein